MDKDLSKIVDSKVAGLERKIYNSEKMPKMSIFSKGLLIGLAGLVCLGYTLTLYPAVNRIIDPQPKDRIEYRTNEKSHYENRAEGTGIGIGVVSGSPGITVSPGVVFTPDGIEPGVNF